MQMRNGSTTTDVELLLGLIQEITKSTALPDVSLTVGLGKLPATDRAYWSPIPLAHWLAGPGFWTVPLPSPIHLRAHALGLVIICFRYRDLTCM